MDKIVMYIDINSPGYSVHAAIHNTVVRGERPAPWGCIIYSNDIIVWGNFPLVIGYNTRRNKNFPTLPFTFSVLVTLKDVNQ